jgi:hypothetical protein
MKALQLRSLKPELQSVSIDDLIGQIMASEGMGTPGAGSGTLADLFPTQLSPSSPAPMEAARLVAPKPTAAIIPAAGAAGVDAYREAQKIRQRTERGPTPEERSAANARVDDLAAGLRKPAVATAAPEVAPVREASPVAAALAAAGAPEKPKFTSRLRPQYEAAQAELEQLTARRDALTAQRQPVDANTTYGIQIKSGVVSKLKAMVDAEEAAVVDAESAAVLERQTNRLTREEELVKQARKRAPGDALIAFGGALAGAKVGEKFASALTRGLVAGNESYTNARNAGEESSRTIEEKRDALILKNRELIEKARADAINRVNSGAVVTEGEMRLANLNQEGVDNLAMSPFRLSEAKSKASKAKTEADTALETINAENDLRRKQGIYYENYAGGRGGDGGDKPMTANQVQTKIGDLKKERRGLVIKLNAATTVGKEKKAVVLAIENIDEELGALGGGRPAAPARATPAAPAAPASAGKPPVPNARWSSAQQGWFIPDPKRQGKYLQVFN